LWMVGKLSRCRWARHYHMAIIYGGISRLPHPWRNHGNKGRRILLSETRHDDSESVYLEIYEAGTLCTRCC
jgi:hypothetical protein